MLVKKWLKRYFIVITWTSWIKTENRCVLGKFRKQFMVISENSLNKTDEKFVLLGNDWGNYLQSEFEQLWLQMTKDLFLLGIVWADLKWQQDLFCLN
jgi:hypothetical protein